MRKKESKKKETSNIIYRDDLGYVDFSPFSFIGRLENLVEEYAKEKQRDLLSKCCKKCQKKFKNL